MWIRPRRQVFTEKRSAEIKCCDNKVSNLFAPCFVEAVLYQFRLVHPVFPGPCSGRTINLYAEISVCFMP